MPKKKKSAKNNYADRLKHNYGLIFAHRFCMVKTGTIKAYRITSLYSHWLGLPHIQGY